MIESLVAVGVPAEQLGCATPADPDFTPGSTTAGAVASAFAGLAFAAVAGVGTVGAGGILAPLVGGAVAGGIVGRLVEGGVAVSDAQVHAEALRRGCTIVSADIREAHVEQVHAVMLRAGAVSVDQRRSEYMEEGWNGFDASRRPLGSRQRAEERRRHEADEQTVLPLPPVH